MSSSQVDPDAAASTSGVRHRQVNKGREEQLDNRGPVESPADARAADDDEDAPPKAAKTYGRTPEGTSELPSPAMAMDRRLDGHWHDGTRLC